MDNLEQKLRKIVMTGIGAIVDTVEKSKDAIKGFAQSEQVSDFAKKGEEAVKDAVALGNKAVNHVKNVFTDAEIADKMEKEKAKLTDLAKKVDALSKDQRDVFESLLKDLHEAKSCDVCGMETPNEEDLQGVGKPGVTESDFDLEVDDQSYSRCASEPGKPHDPQDCPTPTAPDDDENAKRSQTRNMNDHIKQSIPLDY